MSLTTDGMIVVTKNTLVASSATQPTRASDCMPRRPRRSSDQEASDSGDMVHSVNWVPSKQRSERQAQRATKMSTLQILNVLSKKKSALVAKRGGRAASWRFI